MAHRTRRRSLWTSLGDRSSPRLNASRLCRNPCRDTGQNPHGTRFLKPDGAPQHLNCACFSDGAAMPSVSSCAALTVLLPRRTSIHIGIVSESAFRASRCTSRFPYTHRNTILRRRRLEITASVAQSLARAVAALAHFRSCQAEARCRYSRPLPDRF